MTGPTWSRYCGRCGRYYSGRYSDHRLSDEHRVGVAARAPHAFEVTSPTAPWCRVCGDRDGTGIHV